MGEARRTSPPASGPVAEPDAARIPRAAPVRVRAALLAVAVALTGCTGAPSTRPSTPTSPIAPAVSAPADVEVDRQVAAALEAEFSLGGYEDLRSVLVIAGGRTVFRRSFSSAPTQYHPVWSVTASVVSTLVGIAIDQGHITGTDATLAELLPDRANRMTPDVAGTTLEQLLTMTGGFVDVPVRPGADWVDHILTNGSTGVTSWAYSNSSAHLVSAILTRATGMSTLDYARRTLFEPLGIHARAPEHPDVTTIEDAARGESSATLRWTTDPQGINLGGEGLSLRAQDMARIGLLYLNGGTWEGRQVVPTAWVDMATTMASPAAYRDGYGYLWWVDRQRRSTGPAYSARGACGQRIIVDPDRQLVVVTQVWTDTADPEFWRSEAVASALNLVHDSIIAPSYPPQGA